MRLGISGKGVIRKVRHGPTLGDLKSCYTQEYNTVEPEVVKVGGIDMSHPNDLSTTSGNSET